MQKLEGIKYLETIKRYGLVQTNDYKRLFYTMEEEVEGYHTEKSLLVVQHDHGVNRLLYYTLDLCDLTEAIKRLDNQEYVMEYITKNSEEKDELFKKMGFQVLTRIKRVAVKDCTLALGEQSPVMEYFDSNIGQVAKEKEAEEINQILWKVFDTRISRLLDREEVRQAIQKQEFTIERNQKEEIEAILQVKEQAKRFYINQIYNGGEKKIIHAMMLNRLKKYSETGGRYIYAWIDEKNIASIKFHKKYGMEPDGIWDIIYFTERKGYKK